MSKMPIGRVFLGAALLAVVGAAIPAATHAADRPNSLRAGTWAIQFGIDGNFRLTSYEGGFFSVKRHFSDRSALRAVVDGGFTTEDREQGYTNGDTRIDRTVDSWSLGLTLIYQRYFNPGDDVVIQFGVGPSIAYDKQNYKYADVVVGTDTTEAESSKRTTHRTGGVIAFGAEYFLTRVVSLHAEYSGYLGYSSVRETIDTTWYTGAHARSVDKSDNWSAKANNVRFGLSVYF